MNSPTPIAYNIENFKNRDAWIKLFLAADDDELSFTAKVVGVRIALHHNVETGKCNPSLPKLAAGTGMSERNVRRMLHELEETGWLRTDRSPGRHTHSFELTVPTNPDNSVRDQISDPDTPVRVHDSSTRTRMSGLPGQTGSLNPDTVVRQKRESRTAKRKAKEIDSPSLEEDSGRRDRTELSQIDAAFEEFWGVYPLKKERKAAAKAYRNAIKEGVLFADVLAGAMRYAAERTGQDPKYTKHPATWLNKGCWADDPVPVGSSVAPPSGYGHHLDQAIADAQAIAQGGGQ